MTDNQLNSVVDYLFVDSKLNVKNFQTIHELYKQLVTQIPDNVDDQVHPNETILTEVARQLNIRDDTDESRDYLRDCVRYEDINDCKSLVEIKFLDDVKPLDVGIFNGLDVSQSTPSINVKENIKILDKIICVLNIKMTTPEVKTFIHSFLLQKVGKPVQASIT
jgi:hypothetical protein